MDLLVGNYMILYLKMNLNKNKQEYFIMIYKLQKGKIVTKAISLAEKLGIPKAMRSNPKSLEDPYY